MLQKIPFDKSKINLEEVRNFNFPLIDYSLHPAFNFPGEDKKLSKQIDLNIDCLDKEIDIIIKNLSQKKKLSKKQFGNEFKKFNFYIDELVNIVDDLKKEKANNEYFHIYNSVKNSLVNTKTKIQEEIHFLINKENNYTKNLDISIDLEKYGFSLYKLEKSTIEKLIKLLSNEITQLKNNSVIGPGPRKLTSFNYRKNFFKFNQLKKIIKKTILYYEIKKLFPKIDISGITLDYSYPKSNWYKNCYSDLKIESKGAYFHVDYEYDFYKSGIYLSDVNRENGPLSYIPGSNNMRRNKFLFRYFKELDIELKEYFKNQINQKKKYFGPRKYYYRKHFMLDALRRQLTMIPKQLLGTSHFGDDLITSDKMYKFLQKHEFKITTDIANAVTFNGHDGIHRGGLTEKGERIMLFMTWCNKKSLVVHCFNRLKSLFLKKIFTKRS